MKSLKTKKAFKVFTAVILSIAVTSPKKVVALPRLGEGEDDLYQESVKTENEDEPFREVRSKPSETGTIENEKLVKLAERYLTGFDEVLASHIKPYVAQLNEKEKRQFLKDIEEMNELVEDEIYIELFSQAESEDYLDKDIASAYGEIAKKAITRIVNQYKSKPWMERILKFAGNELAETLNEL